jgi:hypothetical protein
MALVKHLRKESLLCWMLLVRIPQRQNLD